MAFQTLRILKLSSWSLSFSSNLIFRKVLFFNNYHLHPSINSKVMHKSPLFPLKWNTSSALFHCIQQTRDNCSLPPPASTTSGQHEPQTGLRNSMLSPPLTILHPAFMITSPHLYPKPWNSPQHTQNESKLPMQSGLSTNLWCQHLPQVTTSLLLPWSLHPHQPRPPVGSLSPGGGHGDPLQCSCLENPMDRGACWATVHEREAQKAGHDRATFASPEAFSDFPSLPHKAGPLQIPLHYQWSLPNVALITVSFSCDASRHLAHYMICMIPFTSTGAMWP